MARVDTREETAHFSAMPIYEYYCSQNHTIYQFYAKTLAQGKLLPKCPDNPKWTLQKTVSQFTFTGRAAEPSAAEPELGAGGEDPRMEAAMQAMESEFSAVDENDPRAMGRMMRRMAELTGEKIDGEMEEVVRKLEEGADPEALDEQMGGSPSGEGGEDDPYGESPSGLSSAQKEAEGKEARMRYRLRRAVAPRRDPQLYDY
jgi:hypothetical protein